MFKDSQGKLSPFHYNRIRNLSNGSKSWNFALNKKGDMSPDQVPLQRKAGFLCSLTSPKVLRFFHRTLISKSFLVLNLQAISFSSSRYCSLAKIWGSLNSNSLSAKCS